LQHCSVRWPKNPAEPYFFDFPLAFPVDDFFVSEAGVLAVSEDFEVSPDFSAGFGAASPAGFSLEPLSPFLPA
jgi:hypothetical protein